MSEPHFEPQDVINNEGQPSRTRRIWPFLIAIPLGICALAAAVVIAIGVSAFGYADDISLAVELIVPVEMPISTGTGLSYGSLHDKRDDLTNSGWRSYLRSVVGEEVKWSGYVDHVDEYGQVWIDMDRPNSGDDTPDVYLRLEKDSPVVTDMEHGRPVTFEGAIKGVEAIQTPSLDSFIVSIEDGIIEIK